MLASVPHRGPCVGSDVSGEEDAHQLGDVVGARHGLVDGFSQNVACVR
jgi:hypothetical protein